MKYCGREKISIIVIVYNVEDYLEECIESIRRQSYENVEILLVDDGSLDKSREICERFAGEDNRIKVIYKENGGLVSARKAGIMAATGDYAAFVDGDDWVDEDMYERLYLEARLHDADIVLSGIVREIPNARRCDRNAISDGVYDKRKLEQEIYPKMMYSMENRSCLVDPSLCNKLFSIDIIREALLQVDENIFYLGEDAATTFPCLLKASSIYVTSYCMYHHRIVIQKTGSTYKREKVYERLLVFYRNLKENFCKTVYGQMMIPQLNGYFLHLLNVVTREAIDLDILMFYQALVDYGKQGVVVEEDWRYHLPAEELLGYKDIILYGAGNVGKDYYKQLKRNGMNVVMWVDKQAEKYRNIGLDIGTVEEMKEISYEAVILAAKREEMAVSMKKDLMEEGIPENVIKWIRPVERE